MTSKYNPYESHKFYNKDHSPDYGILRESIEVFFDITRMRHVLRISKLFVNEEGRPELCFFHLDLTDYAEHQLKKLSVKTKEEFLKHDDLTQLNFNFKSMNYDRLKKESKKKKPVLTND